MDPRITWSQQWLGTLCALSKGELHHAAVRMQRMCVPTDGCAPDSDTPTAFDPALACMAL